MPAPGRIIHFVHQSADGYIEGPKGEFDWPAMGGELSDYSHDLTGRADAFLYGRKVWELMAGYWPRAEELSHDEHDLRFAPVWRSTPKVVVSRTLKEAGWNTRILREDYAEQLTTLRNSGKTLLLVGGSELAAALTARDLIDEYQIVVHPVILGGGKPVFRDGDQRIGLRLEGSRVLDSRTVLLRYLRA
ncbi:dihydrofolate reductase family protein [Streptomyces sp. NPDC003042]